LFINGALAGSVSAAPLASGAGASLIGRLGSSFYPFQGSLDEVAVFGQPLTPEPVRAHYEGGASVRVVVGTASATGTLTSSVAASSAESDVDPSNNTLTLTSTMRGPSADLSLSGSVAPEPVTAGDALTYSLALANRGPASASAATVTLALPAAAVVVSSTTSQGSCSASGSRVSCALGALGVGAAGQVLADRPAGYWRLGEPANSGTAVDSSGNGLSGSYESGITLGQPGAVSGDTAAAFNGPGAVDLPDAPALDLSGTLSVEAWGRPSLAGQSGGIFEKTIGGAVNTQYSLLIERVVLMFRATPASGPYVNAVGQNLTTAI